MNDPGETISIRLATQADIPQLCDLLAGLFEQEADFKPDAERQARALGLILDEPVVGRIYCAVAVAKVIGMVSILFTVSTAEGGRAAWLEDMVIHPEWRGQKTGERLLQAALQGAQMSGCSRVTLLTDAVNAPARRFYERAGFKSSSMIPYRRFLPS